MGTTATQMPPFSQAIVDPKTGLATPNMGLWQQELLRARQAWIPYTPTVTHLSAITVNDCAFQVLGKLVAVRIALTGTTDGSSLNVTLPFKAKSQNQTFAVQFQGNMAGVTAMFADLITLGVAKYDATTPANGVVLAVVISGAYEAQ